MSTLSMLRLEHREIDQPHINAQATLLQGPLPNSISNHIVHQKSIMP